MPTAAAPITRRRVVDRAFNFVTAKAFEDNGERIIEGIATTPRVDRAGDTIDPLGLEFVLPIPLLWQHDPERPIGEVISAKVTPQGVTFRAVVQQNDALPALNTRWAEITSGLVKGMSIGFRATKPPTPTKTGYRYGSTEWLELSCVTIAANPDCAITTIKAFEIGGAATVPAPIGEPAANDSRPRAKAMTLKERIAARKARLVELRTRAAELIDADERDDTELDQVNADIETESTELAVLVRTQANIAAEAVQVVPVAPQNSPVVPVQRNAPAILSQRARTLEKDRPKAQLLFRSCAAHVLAYVHNVTPDQAAAQLYTGDDGLKAYLAVQKAAVEPALTTVPEWAGTLVRETWGEFLDLLLPASVYAQLSALGSRFSFGQSGKIILPTRNKTPNLAGDFVGENAPIPVKKGSIISASLTPKKLAVISAFSQEMSTASGGQIENYIRDFMIEDTAQVLDTRLLDNVAATVIRPAGLLNGVTLTPSSGATLADIITDIKAAMGPILANNGGRRLVWLMNPLQAMTLGLQTNAAGAFIWPNVSQGWNGASVIVSNNVPLGTLILVDAADFATVANDTPQFRVSAEATLHMEDTAPEPINDGTPATPVISLFQQDSFAVRMIQQMNWVMRRPGMVTGISGITW